MRLAFSSVSPIRRLHFPLICQGFLTHFMFHGKFSVLVFSCESSRPLGLRNSSIRGMHCFSNSSLELPVTICQSDEALTTSFLMALTLIRWPKPGVNLSVHRSSPFDLTTLCNFCLWHVEQTPIASFGLCLDFSFQGGLWCTALEGCSPHVWQVESLASTSTARRRCPILRPSCPAQT